MGAWGTTIPNLKDKAECRSEVRDFCENEESDVKDVDFYDRDFKTLDEAKDFVHQKADKWGNAAAASYLGLPDKLKESASKKKLDILKKETVPAKVREIENQMSKMGEIRKTADVEFVKCPSCDSKINSKHLVGFDSGALRDAALSVSYGCPACREKGLLPKFLKAEMKSLSKLIDQLNDLRDKATALHKKIEDENPKTVLWVVSVFIPS